MTFLLLAQLRVESLVAELGDPKLSCGADNMDAVLFLLSLVVMSRVRFFPVSS